MPFFFRKEKRKVEEFTNEMNDERYTSPQNKIQQQKGSVKVWVKNLPEGLTEKGVKNLFLTVGTPLCISFNPRNNSALVTFELMNEAELAVRDLHMKPPYYIDVTIANQRIQKCVNSEIHSEPWDFSVEPDPVESCRVEDNNEKINELVIQVENVTISLGYDPLLRMRQNKLDFKTGRECVYMGRGYINMGSEDRYVGGLEKFVIDTGNSKLRDIMNFYCENCKARTSRICGYCNASYCSESCLRCSPIDHRGQCAPGGNDEEFPEDARNPYCSPQKEKETFPGVNFTSGCTVTMSFYSSMRTVFVRRSDGPWDEKFARLCNVVAGEAYKGIKLEEAPKDGDVVAARYYQDLCFYRGRVSYKADGKISVFFLDFGNTQETHLKDLRLLPGHLKSVPGYAVQVHLKDVSEASSLDSVDYYNKLTAYGIPLIMNFENSASEVVLVEKDSKTVVNENVRQSALPTWKRRGFNFSKLVEVYYLEAVQPTRLEVGKKCSLIVSHFDESEFADCGVFWVTHTDTNDFLHASSKMRLEMIEYCELFRDDCYLPRINELCLAKENGEWHRCVNLENYKTTCCLFFLDDGHSASVETKNIRKMIQDFTEAPSQAVSCVLTDMAKLKTDEELRSKVVKFLKDSVGRRIDSISVLELQGDDYCLSIPGITEILTSPEA